MIQTLIFDLGGVIIKHQHNLMPIIISEVFAISEKQGTEIWHEHKDALLTGELPSIDFLNKIKTELSITTPIQTLLDSWTTLYEHAAKGLNTELLDMISKLKQAYRVYLLTDTLDTHHAFNDKRGIYAHFDGVYASHLEGKSKSQGKSAFELFLKNYKLQAEHCVFIDDMEAYVSLAISLGLQAFVYTSNDQLVRDLKSIGVKVT